MRVALPQNAFAGTPLYLELPGTWQVDLPVMAADTLPPLSLEQMREKLCNPIGCPSLGELARRAHKVVIIFDDASRGTPVRPMAELVLEELHQAGLAREQIRFVCALGAHGALNREDFVRKLGPDIVEHYLVCNHSAYEGCVYLGETARGTPLWINRDVAACDLKIGLGAITAHIYNGFGGGGKILLPGVAGIQSIEANHRLAVDHLRANRLSPISGMGRLNSLGMREDIEEAARIAGLGFKVDAILNSSLEIVDLFAGDPVQAFHAGVPRAQALYGIRAGSEYDMVIVNANAKATEASLSMYLAATRLRRGGTVVVVNNAPQGQVTHYLLGPLGADTGGRMWKGPSKLSAIGSLIILSAYPDLLSGRWFCIDDRLRWARSWADALQLLEDPFGEKRVLVLRDGTLQYFTVEADEAAGQMPDQTGRQTG